jgi:hypothetical protein
MVDTRKSRMKHIDPILREINKYINNSKLTGQCWAQWCEPVVPATREAEAGGSLELIKETILGNIHDPS